MYQFWPSIDWTYWLRIHVVSAVISSKFMHTATFNCKLIWIWIVCAFRFHSIASHTYTHLFTVYLDMISINESNCSNFRCVFLSIYFFFLFMIFCFFADFQIHTTQFKSIFLIDDCLISICVCFMLFLFFPRLFVIMKVI